MALIAEKVALEVVDVVVPLLPRVRRGNGDLYKQINRALCSAAMNIAEAQYNDDGNRRARFHSAAGSANETRMGLMLSWKLGYIGQGDWEACNALLVRLLQLLWALTRGRAK